MGVDDPGMSDPRVPLPTVPLIEMTNMTMHYEPDAASHPIFDLPVGAGGYLVERRGGRRDPETGEPIFEPGDPVWVYPVTIGPRQVETPLQLTRWQRVRRWVRRRLRR